MTTDLGRGVPGMRVKVKHWGDISITLEGETPAHVIIAPAS